MAETPVTTRSPATAAVRTYEIGLDGDVVDLVRRLDPDARVHSVPATTVLCRETGRRDDLDTLLEMLFSIGLAPREVHVSPDYCELRVDGSLGVSLLHHLRWPHHLVQTTVIRVQRTGEALRPTLRALTEIARLDYVVAC